MAGEVLEGDRASFGNVKNSAALLGDLEEVRIKIEKYHANRNTSEFPEVDASSAALVECYRLIYTYFFSLSFSTLICRKNKTTPLNCWSEVGKFKSAVEKLEQVRMIGNRVLLILIPHCSNISKRSRHDSEVLQNTWRSCANI